MFRLTRKGQLTDCGLPSNLFFVAVDRLATRRSANVRQRDAVLLMAVLLPLLLPPARSPVRTDAGQP